MKTFRLLTVYILLQVPLAAAYAGLIDYTIDGKEYQGYHSRPKKKPVKGTVIIIHDWDGLTDYEIKRAEMLVKDGYEAFAVDLYGKNNRPTETKAKKAETGKLYKDRVKMRKLILGGIAEARRLGAGDAVVMGYCFGGAAVLELARSGKGTAIKGYATFHGGLKTPAGQSYQRNTSPIFIAHGGADKGIPMSDVADLGVQLEAGKVDYEIEVYSGALHAFTVFGSDRYQKKADEKSWASFGRFLNKQFRGPQT